MTDLLRRSFIISVLSLSVTLLVAATAWGQLNQPLLIGAGGGTVIAITACGSNTCTFSPGMTNPIGQAVATLSNGGEYSGSWTMPTSGTDHSGTACPNNAADFTLSSSGLLSSTAASASITYIVCIAAGTFVQAVTLNPTGNVSCDQGPSTTLPTGSLGTDLSTAGFTHCALNADFTDSSGNGVSDGSGGTTWIMKNTATWLSECGSTTTWRFYLLKGEGFLGGDTIDAACGKAVITTNGGSQVLHIQMVPSDVQSPGNPGNNNVYIGLRLWWPICGVSCQSSEPALPGERYIEITSRFDPGGLSQSNTGIIWSMDSQILPGSSNQSGYGWMDFSLIEFYSNSPNPIAVTSLDDFPNRGSFGSNCCSGFDWRSTEIDPTHYHTYGFLYTSDESTAINACLYYDGALVVPSASTGHGENCDSHVPNRGSSAPPPPPPAGDPKWYGSGTLRVNEFIGAPGGPAVLNNNIDLYIKSIRVFECSGYKTGTIHHCPGTLVFHSVPPQ